MKVTGPRLVVLPEPGAVADEAARVLLDSVGEARAAGRTPVVGVATGSTPQPLYARVAEAVATGAADLADVWAVALDEYVGLAADDPRRYRAELLRTVVGPWGLDPGRLLVPDADAPEPDVAGAAYDARIAALGGVDVQVLGIGRNGHLGFNEPGADAGRGTHRVRLAESTREANAAHFPDPRDVPREALTQGLATILRARRLLLVATSEAKAPALAAALRGPVHPDCPASVLQQHPDVLVVADEAAAGLLR